MTIDTKLMLDEVAPDLLDQQGKYTTAVEELKVLVTETLGQYWNDNNYEKLKDEYNKKHNTVLKDVGNVLQSFPNRVAEAAEEFEEMFNK